MKPDPRSRLEENPELKGQNSQAVSFGKKLVDICIAPLTNKRDRFRNNLGVLSVTQVATVI